MSKEINSISSISESELKELIQSALDQGWELVSIYYRYHDDFDQRGWHYAWLTKEKNVSPI